MQTCTIAPESLAKIRMHDSIRVILLGACWLAFAALAVHYFSKMTEPITIERMAKFQTMAIAIGGIAPVLHLATGIFSGSANYLGGRSSLRLKALSILFICLFGPLGWLVCAIYIVGFFVSAVCAKWQARQAA